MKTITYLLIFTCLPLFGQDIETFSWKEARLNDKIELTLTKELFDKKYKADSIAAPEAGETCAPDEEKVSMVYYKGAKFEMQDNVLKFRSIDFSRRKGMYFSIKDDWFDHTTTLKSFIKTYPVAAEYIQDEITEDGDVYDMVTLLPEGEDNYEWRFFFNEGKLLLIECWQYCE